MSSPAPIPVPAPATRVTSEEAIQPPPTAANPDRPATAPSSNTIHLPGTFPDLETNAFWEGPFSPGTMRSVLDGYENLGPVQLRQLATGLASTLQQWEALFQDEARCLKIQQIDREPLLCPDGYVENNGRLPEFTITTPNGEKPALYARPDFDDFPLSPLPPWFRARLWGTEVDYHPLREAVINLDDWPLLAEVTRYRVLDRECDTLRAELRLAQANLAVSEAAKEACEDRLIAARAMKKIPMVGVERSADVPLAAEVQLSWSWSTLVTVRVHAHITPPPPAHQFALTPIPLPVQQALKQGALMHTSALNWSTYVRVCACITPPPLPPPPACLPGLTPIPTPVQQALEQGALMHTSAPNWGTYMRVPACITPPPPPPACPCHPTPALAPAGAPAPLPSPAPAPTPTSAPAPAPAPALALALAAVLPVPPPPPAPAPAQHQHHLPALMPVPQALEQGVSTCMHACIQLSMGP
ncbi:hypothetical protein BJV74DRAFT_883677 [Russula compacta]|nr:hypothetical protein BJV74DRAFT_883677 [Russula compacta]